ncbi:hypothetical protein H0H92_000906 [Tricholoma furcatifolium]|nr:hypothetical protein H0H92_000906 [Tricholoma furcatifolium]
MNGDLAPHSGPGLRKTEHEHEHEHDMISLFLALNRDEMREDEVKDLAGRVIIPLLKDLADEYLKSNPPKRQREIAYSYRSEDAKRRCRSSLKEFFVPPAPSATSLMELRLGDDLSTEVFAAFSKLPMPVPVPATSEGSQLLGKLESDGPAHDLSLNIPAGPSVQQLSVSSKPEKQLAASIPRSPCLGISSRAINVQRAPLQLTSGQSKHLAAQKRLALQVTSRRSSTANKENIPPANYRR